MAPKYAKDQPAGFINRIERVAIVGAGGRIGSYFASSLLATGRHEVTAITRAESTSKLPDGIKKAIIDYSDESTLVAALKDIQFLVITLSAVAPPPASGVDPHTALVRAAAQAGVRYIMPNAYGGDFLNAELIKEDLYATRSIERCQEIEELGMTWIALSCGFWYEWSLACGSSWFGFDIGGRKVTFFDAGTTRIQASTWEQCGRAIAGLLSLPELPVDADDARPAVSSWADRICFISSFRICQRDMLDSLERLTGTKDEDWEIEFEPTKERYAKGLEAMKGGDRLGFARALYARGFFQSGEGDVEARHVMANEALGLKEDDLDAATKRTLEMVESGWTPFG